LVIFFLSLYGQAGTNDKLIDFKLEDQFDKMHTRSDYAGKIIVIVGSDRKGSEYNSQWVESLWDSIKTDKLDSAVTFVGVANLGAVPFFMQSIVQGFFPEDTTKRILMDWDDMFAENYNFKDDHCNLAIFGKQDDLIAGFSVQNYDEKIFREILSNIKKSIQKGIK